MTSRHLQRIALPLTGLLVVMAPAAFGGTGSVYSAAVLIAIFAVMAYGLDVIVSDLSMPGEDGLTFVKRLRALPDEEGGAVPAIALTGFDHPNEQHALAAGFQAYLRKPPDFGAMCRVFARLGLPAEIRLADTA